MSGKFGGTKFQPLSFNENQDSDAFFDDDYCDETWQDDTSDLDNLLEGGELDTWNTNESSDQNSYEKSVPISSRPFDRPYYHLPVQFCTKRNFRIIAVLLIVAIVVHPTWTQTGVIEGAQESSNNNKSNSHSENAEANVPKASGGNFGGDENIKAQDNAMDSLPQNSSEDDETSVINEHKEDGSKGGTYDDSHTDEHIAGSQYSIDTKNSANTQENKNNVVHNMEIRTNNNEVEEESGSNNASRSHSENAEANVLKANGSTYDGDVQVNAMDSLPQNSPEDEETFVIYDNKKGGSKGGTFDDSHTDEHSAGSQYSINTIKSANTQGNKNNGVHIMDNHTKPSSMDGSSGNNKSINEYPESTEDTVVNTQIDVGTKVIGPRYYSGISSIGSGHTTAGSSAQRTSGLDNFNNESQSSDNVDIISNNGDAGTSPGQGDYYDGDGNNINGSAISGDELKNGSLNSSSMQTYNDNEDIINNTGDVATDPGPGDYYNGEDNSSNGSATYVDNLSNENSAESLDNDHHSGGSSATGDRMKPDDYYETTSARIKPDDYYKIMENNIDGTDKGYYYYGDDAFFD